MAATPTNTTISTLRNNTPYLAGVPALRPMPKIVYTAEGMSLEWQYTVSTINATGQPTDIIEGDQIAEPNRAPGTVILRFDLVELGQMMLTVVSAAGPG